ncbi:acyl-CoA dehydrogenase-like protein [Saccharothrix carnea]|uniref:Acyl-CoA dehydrogenase-like protein n=1 Tax=Saccharothrix carnea TaxID=1280637 RepID=A0A2P8IF18_SACCR|nr:acyl-CoA dehydrogenase family protein [Saccharothrix carnea]PSL57068.1 acyl-CoA dehydrogenase-like protein [Saccharothrix carnea]
MDHVTLAESVRADAAEWDRAGGVPTEVVRAVAEAGFPAADVPTRVVAEHAVRLHGAAGIAPDSAVGRFHRDAAVMGIVEGADEVAEQHLGGNALRGGS